MATTALPGTLAPASTYGTPRKRRRLGHYVVVALLLAAMAFYLMPVYVLVMNGLMDKSYMTQADMWRLPRGLSGGGFGDAWEALRANLW